MTKQLFYNWLQNAKKTFDLDSHDTSNLGDQQKKLFERKYRIKIQYLINNATSEDLKKKVYDLQVEFKIME